MKAICAESRFPECKEDIDIIVLTTTALAHYALFGKIACSPLSEASARSFLEVILLPGIFPEEKRVHDGNIVEAFCQRLSEGAMAWTEADRAFLEELVHECLENLKIHFGKLDLKRPIEWEYTRGLCIR
jgi:hypothetical protein